MYEAVIPTLYGERGSEKAISELLSFVNNPGLSELARLYGEDISVLPSRSKLSVLGNLAATYWDFRKGAERQTTDWSDDSLNQEGSVQRDIIFNTAAKLGMVASSRSANQTPDYLVILGGANRSPLDRLRYGLENVDRFGQLVYMGSSRPLSEIEKSKVKDYAPGASTEFDLGCSAFETYLEAVPVKNIRVMREGEEWGIEAYDFTDANSAQKRAFALNSPQIVGEHRATTYDNYRFLAETIGLQHHTTASIVSVTTGFYIPGQHAPAVQEITLPYGVTVETIGHDAAYSGAHRLPTQLLQEAKAAIDGYTRLYDRLTLLNIGHVAVQGDD